MKQDWTINKNTLPSPPPHAPGPSPPPQTKYTQSKNFSWGRGTKHPLKAKFGTRHFISRTLSFPVQLNNTELHNKTIYKLYQHISWHNGKSVQLRELPKQNTATEWAFSVSCIAKPKTLGDCAMVRSISREVRAMDSCPKPWACFNSYSASSQSSRSPIQATLSWQTDSIFAGDPKMIWFIIAMNGIIGT